MTDPDNAPSLLSLSSLLRYGVAVVAVAVALGLALLLRTFDLRESFFLMAIAVAVWFGGMGPGLLAIVLSVLTLDYFFIPPIYHIERDLSHLPYFVVFGLFGLLISWLSRSRRRAEEWLRQARDELEKRVAERTAELREQASLLNLTHDTIFVRDMADAITYWNRGAEELYGWKAEEAMGKITHQLMQTVFPEPLEGIQKKLLSDGRWEGELVHTKADGKIAVVASRWALQRDDQGRPVRILETNNDITERRQSEQALREAQNNLAHMSRVTTMGELTASLAHEVNQPIAAAVTDASTCLRWLTRENPELEEARQAASRVVKDATRAGEIISRIRTLFKKGASQRELVDINEVVDEIITLVQNQTRRHLITIRTELADGLPQIMADRIQLQQVFMNLVLNGIEAIKETGTAGELAIQSRQSEDGQLLVSIRDTGVGLPPEKASHIFDAFFTTKDQGLGMGLSISRSIIESHGGRMWASANPVRGASFHLTLPSKLEAHE